MKKVLLLCFWLISSLALAQSPFTVGNFYTTTPTSGTPSATGSRIRIDLSNGWIYQWNPVALTWQRVGQGIDIFASVSDPAYAPTGNMSWFVVNDLDKFFKYSGSGTAWDCLNCYDVTFAGDLTGNETSQTVVALQGRAVSATAPGTGEVLKWNGTSWVPSADLGTTYTGGAGIDVTGTVITNTGDLSNTNEIQTLTAGDGAGDNKTLDLSLSGGTVTLDPAGILTISRSSNTLTLTATEVDGSTSNELQTYSHSGTTSYTNTLSAGGGSFTLQAAGIASISHSGGTVTITATEVDGSVSNEIQTIIAGDGTGDNKTLDLSLSGGTIILDPAGALTLSRSGNTLTFTVTEIDGSITNEGALTVNAGTGTTSVISSNTSGSTDVTLSAAGILAISESGNTITLTATEVDGSTTNEVLTISDGTDSEALGGQTLTVSGSGIVTADYVIATNTLTITGTEVDGSVSNEGSLTVAAGTGTTSIINSNTSGSTGVTLTAAGALSISESGNVITLTATEVDGSVSNEGSLTVNAGSGTTSVISSNTSGSTDVTLTAAGILAISESGNTITLTATEVDGSVTNEAWTVSDGSNTELISNQTVVFAGSGGAVVSYNPTTNTVTINAGSSSGGDNWGSQVVQHDASLAGDGTSGDALGIEGYAAASNGEFPSKSVGGITWQTVDLSETNEIQTISAGDGAGDNKTIDLSLSGGTVTLDPAGILAITRSGNTLTMTATEVDGSVTNEVLTISDGTDSEALGGQTLNVAASGIASVDYVPGTNTLTIGAVEIDGSTSNELQTYSHSGTTSYTNTLSAGGGSFTLQAAGIAAISHTTGTVTITATEVDGSVTNEAWTIDGDDADTEVISNQTVKFQGAGITTTDYNPATDVLLITSTEVDGSISNEGSLTVAAGTGTTSIINSNTSGSTGVTLTAAGALSISESGNVITLTATEVDGSVSNEGSLTVNAGTGTTSVISSNTSGSTDVTLTAAGILAISESGNTITLTATEVDGSVTNEVLTISDGTDSEALGGQTLNVAASGIASVDYVPGTNTLTIGAVEADGSTTNEIQTISAGDGTGDNKTIDLSLSGGTVTLDPAGILTISRSSNTLTLTATEVDGSVSNEGSLTVNAGTGTTSIISSNTSGSTDVTLTAGSGIAISESGNIITISATAGGSNYQVWRDDGSDATAQPNANFVSTSDIAFTLANDGANSETEVTADIPAGAVDLSEIQNISTGVVLGRSTAGSGVTEQITVSTGLSISGGNLTATDASATNEAWTIDADDADTELITTQTVKFEGAGIAVTDYNATTDVLLITATEVDGSVTNEGSLTVAAGTGTTSIINSNTSGSTGVTLTAAGALSISESGNVITLTATEVDGSVTNEGSLTVNAGSGTTSVISSNTSGSTDVTLTAAGILAISESGNTITLTATEVDGSTTNEVLTISDGTDSEALGGQTLTVSATGIATVDYVPGTNTLTIGATEVDGSTTNEAWTIDGDDADTEVISNQTVKFQGAGITATDYNATTDVLLITSTEVDGSISNEGSLTVAAGTGTTSIINSNTSGQTGVTLTAAGILAISESGNTITLTATEVDGSTTNEVLTISDGTDSEALGGQTLNVSATGIVSVDYVPGTNTLTIGATETDGSITNEIQALTAGDGSGDNKTLDLSLSGGTVTLDPAGILTISRSSNTLTLTATEVDGSVSNEGSLTVNAGTGTTSIISSNTSGSTDVTLTAGSGISISETGNNITIAATGSGGGAPTDAQYLTLATNGTLSDERVLTAGVNVTTTDAGAGGALTVDALGGNQTTSQLTADQDDWSPTNWSTRTTHYVSSDATMRAITSFGALPDGTVRRIVNTGSHHIYIPGEHPDGTAANRVITDSDIFIPPNGGVVTIFYDDNVDRWRIESASFDPASQGLNGAYGHYYNFSVGATITGDWGTLGLVGNNDVVAATTSLLGGYSSSTASSASGQGSLYFTDIQLNPTEYGLTHSVASSLTQITANLSTSAQRYTVQMGFIPTPSSTTLAVNNSIGIRYSDNINGGNWEGFTRNSGGTESTVDLGVTVTANTGYILTVCVDKGNTEARFYINGVFRGRITTNLPASGADYGWRTGIWKSVGTTQRDIVTPWAIFYTVKGF